MNIHDDPAIANDPTTGLLKRPVGWPQGIFFQRGYAMRFPTITRGEGIYPWDERGARYLDAIAGAKVSALGQGNALTFTYVRYARHQPNIALLRRVSELPGWGVGRRDSAKLAWPRVMFARRSAQ